MIWAPGGGPAAKAGELAIGGSSATDDAPFGCDCEESSVGTGPEATFIAELRGVWDADTGGAGEGIAGRGCTVRALETAVGASDEL